MIIIPLIISLYALLFPSSAAKIVKKKKPVAAAVVQVKQLTEDESRRYQYFWLEAVRQDCMGNYPEAYDLYRHCLDINSDASEAHFAIARYEQVMGNDSIAQMHYERAVALEPSNEEFAENMAEYYLRKGMVDKAVDIFERLSSSNKDRTEYLDILAGIYQQQKEYGKMLQTLNRIEIAEGQSEELTLTKMQVYSFMGDENGAYKELNGLVKSHPNDLNYRVMMGNWLLSNGRKAEAQKEFLNVLKEEPDNAQAQMSMMDYYRAENNMEEADRLLYLMLENPRTDTNTRITLMRQVVSDNESSNTDSTRVLDIFNHILSMPQTTSEMAEMKVAYMHLKNMPQDSIMAGIRQVLDITPENTSARLQLIEMMWNDSVDANVIRECEKAVDYSPEEPTLYYFLGLSRYINDDDKGALQALKDGLRHKSDDTPSTILARMYMIIGDINHHLGNSKASYEAYDSCLVYNPDEISCLNNYAYYLSVENKDLKRAEQMSYKTIKAEPKNGTYLDTYAWILYKQERYEEAKMYIEQLMKVDSASVSADVYDHAGDIFIKTGDRKEALEFWQKALDMGIDTADEVRRKMGNPL